MNKFDAETHRWGMAYRFKDGGLFYPFRQNNIDNDVRWDALSDEGWIIAINMNSVIRAQEHDLIPRSDVDSLIEALSYIINKERPDEKGITDFGISQNIIQMIWSMKDKSKEALSEFQSKHGEQDEM